MRVYICIQSIEVTNRTHSRPVGNTYPKTFEGFGLLCIESTW